MAGVLFFAIDNDLNDTILGCRGVVTAVLVTTAGTHARNGDMRLALRETVAFELLHQLEELHATDVIGHSPERSLRWIGHDPGGLCVDQFIVITQACGFYLRLIIVAINRFDCLAHHAIIAGDHGVFEPEVNIPLFIQCPLEKSVSPGFYRFQLIGREHPRIAFV